VDLVPFLNGSKTGDAHAFIFWLNKQPDDAVRRWLVAVRWKNWRLYKYKEADKWQLFDLDKDPREETDVAAQHPEAVATMARKHAAWKKTLVPPVAIPELPKATPTIQTGHGWVISDGKLRPTVVEPGAKRRPNKEKATPKK